MRDRESEEKPLNLEPLYSFPNESTLFDNVKFDDISKELIDLYCTRSKTFYKFAVVAFILDSEDPSLGSVLQSRVRAGLEPEPTQHEISEARKTFGLDEFGRDRFVIAIKDVPGTVHVQTIKKTRENKLENPAMIKALQEFHYKCIGLSFTVWKNENTGELILRWLNRSIYNKKAFNQNDLALACFTFDRNDDLFERNKFTFAYHLERSIPKKFFEKFLAAAVKDLEISCQYDPRECYSFETEEYWDKVIKLDEAEREDTIKQLLMTQIYLGSAKGGYEIELTNIFRVAKKYHIELDLDYIPSEYDAETNSATALMIAANKGYLETVQLLVEENANLNATDGDRNTALIHAAHTGKLDVVEFLIACGALVNVKNRYNKSLPEFLNIGIRKLISSSQTDEYKVGSPEYSANINRVIKDVINQFPSISRMTEVFTMTTKLAEKPILVYLNDGLIEYLKKNNRIAAKELLNGLPDNLIEVLIILNNTGKNLDNKNSKAIQFLIENGASFKLKTIMEFQDSVFRLDIIRWLALRGDDLKQLLQERFDLPAFGQQLFTSAEDLGFYISRCQLISSLIPNESDVSSLRYSAMNALYEIARELKATANNDDNEFKKEVNFFSSLDSFVRTMPDLIQKEYLEIYRIYAENSFEICINKDFRQQIKIDICEMLEKKIRYSMLTDKDTFIQSIRSMRPDSSSTSDFKPL